MKRKKPLGCVFLETMQKNQPVREFLLKRKREDRKIIGADIFSVQEGFPLGYPLVEKMGQDLWEIRSILPDGICRVFFTIHEETIILLHAFLKKTKKTPKTELKTAHDRLKMFKELNK
jgi:phage-related protein